MNTRRAFLLEAGAAFSGLLLPGITEACGRRRRRCRRSYCEPTECCPPSRHRMAAAFSSGCPIQYVGFVNGKYYYYCHCCGSDSDMPWQFCTIGDTVKHSLGDGYCSGANCDRITLASYYQKRMYEQRTYGPPTFHYSADCVKNGNKDYIDRKEHFQPGPKVKAAEPGSVDYDDGSGTKWVKLFLLTIPVEKPRPGTVIVRIGHELAPKTELAVHRKGKLTAPPQGHYHQVGVGVEEFHVLTRR